MTDTATSDTPPPLPSVPASEPMVSVQSQIGMAVVSLFAVLAFIFHKDFGPITDAVSVLAVSVYGAAIAIARAIKHRTIAQAAMMHNQQRLDAWVVTRNQVHTDARLHAIETRLPEKTTTPRKTTTRR